MGVGLTNRTIITRSTQSGDRGKSEETKMQGDTGSCLPSVAGFDLHGRPRPGATTVVGAPKLVFQVPGGSPKDCALVGRPVFCLLCFVSILDTRVCEVEVRFDYLFACNDGLPNPIFDSPRQLLYSNVVGLAGFFEYRPSIVERPLPLSPTWPRHHDLVVTCAMLLPGVYNQRTLSIWQRDAPLKQPKSVNIKYMARAMLQPGI